MAADWEKSLPQGGVTPAAPVSSVRFSAKRLLQLGDEHGVHAGRRSPTLKSKALSGSVFDEEGRLALLPWQARQLGLHGDTA